MTENSDASSKSLKSELKKVNYNAVETSSKNFKVSQKRSTRSTSDCNWSETFNGETRAVRACFLLECVTFS